MQPYSQDLRDRVFRALERGGWSHGDRATVQGGKTGARKRGARRVGRLPQRRCGSYAAFAFFAGFGCAFASTFVDGSSESLAFSFAANSCFTLRATASVSTLYAWAAALSTFPPSDCDRAGSRITISTVRRLSKPSSAWRTKAVSSLPTDSLSLAQILRLRATMTSLRSSSKGNPFCLGLAFALGRHCLIFFFFVVLYVSLCDELHLSIAAEFLVYQLRNIGVVVNHNHYWQYLCEDGAMKRQLRSLAFALCLLFATLPVFAAKDVAVPATCTPQVNQGLADLIASNTKKDVDNIMICGVATQKSRLQPGGSHGNHHVTTLSVQLPNGNNVNVQVVTNDDLDGVVIFAAQAQVFAYGQGYLTHGLWAAGVHDVHCSTHPSADNGWIYAAGVKTPKSCPNSAR